MRLPIPPLQRTTILYHGTTGNTGNTGKDKRTQTKHQIETRLMPCFRSETLKFSKKPRL